MASMDQDQASGASDAGEMIHITQLPAEILHHIFRWLEPTDLATLPRTCHFINEYVKGNQRLCHDIYLNVLVCSRSLPCARLRVVACNAPPFALLTPVCLGHAGGQGPGLGEGAS
jgi:hypothetical protein